MVPFRLAGAALVVAGIAVTLVYLFGGGGSERPLASPSTDRLNSRILPAEVARVSPPHGARVCPRPEIVVDLLLSDALRRSGALDLSKVRLALDGRDITADARVLGTMDFPQSRASLMYTPRQPLAPGLHRALLTIASAAGPRSFGWTFTVDEVPCP